MSKLLSITAVVLLASVASAEAGHGTCHNYYGAPAYYAPALVPPQAVAPGAPGAVAQGRRDGQVYRSFSYEAQPAAPTYSAPVAPVYSTPGFGMMGAGRGMGRPTFLDAGSKMQGRFGR